MKTPRQPMESHAQAPWASNYWTIWLIAVLVTFLAPEILALVTRHPENTFSNWVWLRLKEWKGETVSQWSAADLLTFCAYVSVFVAWLPWHLWGGKFRG